MFSLKRNIEFHYSRASSLTGIQSVNCLLLKATINDEALFDLPIKEEATALLFSITNFMMQ